MENRAVTAKNLANFCYDGAVYVRAASSEEAREMVCDMTTDKMYEKSDGTWDTDEAEQQEGDT